MKHGALHLACLRARLVLALVLLGLGRAGHAAPAFDSFFSNNGSFEFGSSSPPLTFSSSFETNTTVTGWNVVAQGSIPEWLEGPEAEQGLRYLHLTSQGGLAGWKSGAFLTGTAPFVIGDQYSLTFWAAGGVAAQNALNLGFTTSSSAEAFNISIPAYSQSAFDALGGLDWRQYSVQFTAADATLQFSVAANAFPTVGQNSSIYLDNFSIAAIPEPGSVMLVVLAGVLAGARRRHMAVG
jgi:hypothetical protein